MTEKPVMIPSAEHPITITPSEGHVTVSFAGRTIAETDHALVLQESTYPAVHYLPLDAVDPAVLEPSEHTSWCPFKGEASYYSLSSEGTVAEDAVWSYVSPHDAVAEIAGHVAFYPDKVELTLV